jgi:hypothetical protein
MRLKPVAIAAIALSAIAAPAQAAVTIRFTIDNLMPQGGGIVTQSTLLLHGGDHDILNVGEAASTGIERQAEDALRAISEGSPNPGLIDLFQPYAAANPGAQGLLFDGPTAITLPNGAVVHDWVPGDTGFIDVTVDPSNPNNAYFTLAFMFVASNDAFWGNEDPAAYQLFNADGSFNAFDFIIAGSDILDAGTEFNDEARANTAGLDQLLPDTGSTEGGVIRIHPGFLAPNGVVADGGVLDDPMFANANFKMPGYQVARIRVSLAPDAVPEPATWAMMIAGFGATGFAIRRRKRQRSLPQPA